MLLFNFNGGIFLGACKVTKPMSYLAVFRFDKFVIFII